MFHQQIGVAHRQQPRANADRRAGKKRVGCRFYRIGQLHAANFIVLRRAEHARRRVGFLRIVRGLRQDHFFAIKMRLLRIDQTVKRRVFLARNPFTRVKHRIKRLARVVGETRAMRQRGNVKPVVQQKVNGGTQGHLYRELDSNWIEDLLVFCLQTRSEPFTISEARREG